MPSHGSLWVKHPHHPGGATKISWQPPPVQFEVALPPADMPLDQSLVLEHAVQQSIFNLQKMLLETLKMHQSALQPEGAQVLPAMPLNWMPSDPAVPPVTGAMILTPLLRAIPALRTTQACCPADECPLGPAVKQRLDKVIIHLNDNHAWPREDIADWLDTLDVDLSFPAPQDHGTSGTDPGLKAYEDVLHKYGLATPGAKALFHVVKDASGNWAVGGPNKDALPGPLWQAPSPTATTTDPPSTESGEGGDT